MATYSEVTIKFTNDWIIDDELTIFTNLIGVSPPFIIFEKWVTTRSTNNEVTTGTPTSNLGERAALNYKIAFDLDFPTGYITIVQNINEVVIKSETLGEDFIAYFLGVLPHNTAIVTFNNYVEPPTPPDLTESGIALTRSPHYVNTPFDFDTTTKVTLSIYVWDGDLGTIPSTPTRVLTKIRPTINYAEFNTDLSKIIQENILETPPYDITSTVKIIDSSTNNIKWVHFVASYTDTSTTIADIVGTFVATDGYGYYGDGVNPTTPANKVLTDVAYRKVDRASFVLFPFINDGSITSIDIDTENGEINATRTMVTSNQSTDYIQYISVDVSKTTNDEYLTIKILPAAVEFVYEIIDECKYTPMTVVFKNKYGVFETVTMFKKSTTTLTVKNDEFVNNYITAGTYDIKKHQIQKTNITAKETITLNSGYIKESENELYKQLLISDNVQFYIGGYIPVNVASKSLEFRTRINDSLVKYTIDFDYAYNTINNI